MNYCTFIQVTSNNILLEKIRAIDDETTLNELIKIVDLELKLLGDKVELSQDQKDFVEEGLKEYGEGTTVTHDEAKRQTVEWLRRK